MKAKSEKMGMGITFFIVGLALLVVFSGVVNAESSVVSMVQAGGPTFAVEGYITDYKTDDPIEGAKVCLGENGYCDETDGSGYYLITDIPIGVDYPISVTASGYVPDTGYNSLSTYCNVGEIVADTYVQVNLEMSLVNEIKFNGEVLDFSEGDDVCDGSGWCGRQCSWQVEIDKILEQTGDTMINIGENDIVVVVCRDELCGIDLKKGDKIEVYASLWDMRGYFSFGNEEFLAYFINDWPFYQPSHYITKISELPDLTVSRNDIEFGWGGNDDSLRVGVEGMVDVDIHNEGNAAATDITVRFFDGDTQLEKDVTIPLISAGDVGHAYTDWTLGERNYINVIIDPPDIDHPSGKIPELREDNNRDSISIVLTGFYPPEEGFAFENSAWVESGGLSFGGWCLGMTAASCWYFLEGIPLPPPGDPCNHPDFFPSKKCGTSQLIRGYTFALMDDAIAENANSIIEYIGNPCQADVESSILSGHIYNNHPDVLILHQHAVLAVRETINNRKDILVYDPNYHNELRTIFLDWSDHENCFVMREYYSRGNLYYRFSVLDPSLISQKTIFSVSVFSPVSLYLEDPEGLVISRELNEIADAAYIDSEDLNDDGDLDDLIVISDLKLGDYQITVTPEPDAEDTDTYTLEVTIGDTTIVLAEDAPIAEIPDQPYIIESTGTTINAAPVADSNGPYAGNEGSPITFDASGSYDPDGSIDLYEWDFDGDGVYDVSSATSTAIFTWGDDHTGTVELRVTDNNGLSGTDTATITVNNVAPTASFYVEQPEDFILPYHSLTFNGAFEDAGWLDTHAATWDFGDDTIVSGTLTPIGTTTAEHAYAEPGTYTVTLTVTDDDGGVGYHEEEVIVISAEEAAEIIIDQLEVSIVPAEAPKGVSQKIESAIAKLEQVVDFLDQGKYCNAIGKLDGMITQIEGVIDQVNEQRCSIKECKGKKCNCIADEGANELIESLEHAKEGAIAIRDLISAEHPECA
jgi:hypothetical protein